MQLLPIRTPLLKPGDDIADMMVHGACPEPCRRAHHDIVTGDIVIISSKAVATVEGNEINLRALTVSAEAKKISAESGRDAPYVQAVMHEAARMNGRIVSTAPGGLLTVLRPAGFPRGRLMVPGAGLDQSNIKEGYAIGWPVDPVKSVVNLRKRLLELIRNPKSPGIPRTRNNLSSLDSLESLESPNIAVIISDSCCHPGRLGVTAFALACAGIDPFLSLIGTKDAMGRTMRHTQEAVADQLATAANMIMGNADQLTPAAIIRDHGFALSDYEGWVPCIEQDKDLFQGIMK